MQSSIDAQTSLYYGIDKYCGRLEYLMQLKQDVCIIMRDLILTVASSPA